MTVCFATAQSSQWPSKPWRRHQMFPVLERFEIERMRHFGKIRSYDDAAALAKVGQVGPG